MNRLIKHILFAIAALALVGCHHDDTEGQHSKEYRVRLWGGLAVKQGVTYLNTSRGDSASDSGIITAATDKTLSIGLVRIDQGVDPYYPDFISCDAPLRGEMSTPNAENSYIRDISFSEQAQFFRNSTDAIKYAAWYPWDPSNPEHIYTSNSTATTITLPIDGATDIMHGNVATGTMNSGFNLMQFEHSLCIYRIYVYAMSENGNGGKPWGSVSGMEIYPIPSQCRITLPNDGNGSYTTEYIGAEQTLELHSDTNNIYFNHFGSGENIPVGLNNRRLMSYCVAAPPVDNILSIRLTTTDNESNTQNHTVAIARDFKAGHAYDIVLRFSDHGIINADVSVGEWVLFNTDIKEDVAANMYYDLSVYETANCYTITSGNYGYCFDATVKGNGNSEIVGVVDPSLNIGYVDILWDDTPQVNIGGVMRKTVTLASNRLSEGRIMFNVAGNPNDKEDKRLLAEGNVVIAGYDKPGGKILWTWHIWLSDKVYVQSYTNGFNVMDRNLGAVSANKAEGELTHGLLYQWGRHTPFKKSGTYSSSTERVTSDEAIANPLTLYGDGNIHWLSDEYDKHEANALWGCRHGGSHLDPEKTIYDPCPPGYHVANVRIWENIASYEKAGGFTSAGVNLSIASNDVWYPMQGYIEANGNFVQETELHIWSSSISHESENESPYLLRYLASGLSDVYDGDIFRTHAHPVRCINSNTKSVVHNLSGSQTANCYMIHSTGYYKFKANVRGNGVGSLLPLGGTTTAEINGGLSTTIDPDKVDVLWWQGDFVETAAGVTSPDDFIKFEFLNGGVPDSEGYVTFNVEEFHKGNVILAAYDYDGEILWTWHIWLTDKPADILSGNYTMQDRFLGATLAPTIGASSVTFSSNEERLSTYGFYYQWGRKDPIIGPPSITAGTESVSGNTSASSMWWIKSFDTGEWSSRITIDIANSATIPEVTRNPMTFYRSATAAGRTSSQWFPESFTDGYTNVAMWGYAVENYSIQGQTFSKTMHDPCPPGYRTPFHFAWRYNGTYKYAEGDAGAATTSLGVEMTYDSARLGMVTDKQYFGKMWFPFAGYRNATTGGYASVGSVGRMNTGMPMGQYNTRTFYYNSSVSGQYCGTGTAEGSNNGSAYGLMVRCMKD